MYGNEDEVGAGLKQALASGEVKREDIFVTTKLWYSFI
jgi:glycerol 2-dehydrogenase (NADP+)